MTDEHPDTNRVILTGRVSAAAEQRELPSGDILTTFRVIVRRPAGDRGSVDSVECATTVGKVRRVVERLGEGDRVELEGSLRRRFWRGATGVQSRYAVEVLTLRRVKVSRSDRPTGAGTGPRPVSG